MKRPREPGRVIVGGRCVHTPERQPGNGQARNLLGKRRKNQRRGQRRRAGSNSQRTFRAQNRILETESF